MLGVRVSSASNSCAFCATRCLTRSGRAWDFCFDTAHLHASGYDLSRVEEVWEELDRVIGFDLLKCLHLNDSRAAAGSRVDRHEWIGEGRIGPEPFRRIMRDPDLARVVKIIETPKPDTRATAGV